MLFQVLGLWLRLKEIFFLHLGLTLTEVNIKTKSYRNKITPQVEIKGKNKVMKVMLRKATKSARV